MSDDNGKGDGIAVLKRAVENEFVTALEISNLLEHKYDTDNEYELYMEDYLAFSLDDETDL